MITRRLIQLLITLFLIALLAMVGLILFVDPNRYKDVIVKKVEDTLDRPFAITGDIEWRFWPRLGLTLNGIELGQRAGFTQDNNNQFAKIGEASVYVRIAPLLSKHIDVDKLLIKDAHFYFARLKDGTNNWNDLRKSPKNTTTSDPKTTASPATFNWMINDLAVQNTEIIWNDDKHKQKIDVLIKELSTSLQAHHTNPMDAVFDVVVEPRNIKATVTVDSDYNFDLENQRFGAEHGQIKLKVNGLDGLKNAQDFNTEFDAVRVDLKQDHIQIEKLKASIFNGHLFANVSGDNISKTPHMQGMVSLENINLEQLAHAFGKDLQIKADNLKTLNMEATFKNTTDGFTVDPFAAQLGDTRINGTLSANNAISNIKFNFNVNHIHWAKAQSTPAQSAPTTKVSQNKASTANAQPLQKITAVGDIHIDSASLSGINLQNIDIHINAKNGIIHLAPLKAHLYSGSLTTNTSVNLQTITPHFDINAQLNSINLDALFKDRASKTKFQGQLNLDTQLKTQGLDADSVLNNLAGHAKVNIDQGVLNGMDFNYWLAVGENMLLSAKNLSTLAITTAEAAIGKTDTQQTAFTEMSGSFTLKQGIAQNNDLKIYNDKFYTSGKGQINLPQQTLDYSLHVSPAQNTSHGVQPSDPQIPLKLSGPLQHPHISIDAQGIQALLVQTLKAGLIGTLNAPADVAGASETILNTMTGNNSNNTNTQNQPPPEHVITDALKGLLGK